jgi:hypothetical protein
MGAATVEAMIHPPFDDQSLQGKRFDRSLDFSKAQKRPV